MTTDPTTTEPNPHFADRAKTVADNMKAKTNLRLEVYEDKIRQAPAKAFLVALGSGYLISRLPLTALVAVPLRLTAVLAKPTLLVLGAAKLCDIIEKQSRKL